MGFSEELNRLHAAIYADPDSDEPRLAYARHAEPVIPALAELVRLQVERYRKDVDAGRYHSEPSPRERTLVAKHHADWAQLLAPYARPPAHDPGAPGYEFNRGFPELLRTDAETFVSMGEELLRLGPIRHLELIADGTPLAQVLAVPALRRLGSLHLERWKLGDDDAAAIAACPHLVELAYLGLESNRIGDRGVEALAAEPRTRQLVHVDLRSNPFDGVTVAKDTPEYDDNGRFERFVPTELGLALEAKYGPIPWLHPKDAQGADRWHAGEVLRRRRDRAA